MRTLRVTTITAICALMTTATTTAPLLDVERSNTVSIVAETTPTVPPAGFEVTGSDPIADLIIATTTSLAPPVDSEGEQTTAAVEAMTSGD